MLCAYELFRGPARTLGTPAILAAILFAVVASTLAFRAAWVIVSPPGPDLYAASAAMSLHFLVSLISKILALVSLLMMAAQRLQQQLEDAGVAFDRTAEVDPYTLLPGWLQPR